MPSVIPSGTGVILYGPPGAGKDTVTAALHTMSARFELFRRLKVGPGRVAGYRMGKPEDLDELAGRGHIIYANQRYGATYVIDRPELERMVSRGAVPIIHAGQLEAIGAVTMSDVVAQWLIVELWCQRDIAASRIAARGTGDTAERLRAWDQTSRLATADLQIDTGYTSPKNAAQQIRDAVG